MCLWDVISAFIEDFLMVMDLKFLLLQKVQEDIEFLGKDFSYTFDGTYDIAIFVELLDIVSKIHKFIFILNWYFCIVCCQLVAGDLAVACFNPIFLLSKDDCFSGLTRMRSRHPSPSPDLFMPSKCVTFNQNQAFQGSIWP